MVRGGKISYPLNVLQTSLDSVYPEQYPFGITPKSGNDGIKRRDVMKLEAVEKERGDRKNRERQCRQFFWSISGLGKDSHDLFLVLDDKVVMGKKMCFILKDESE